LLFVSTASSSSSSSSLWRCMHHSLALVAVLVICFVAPALWFLSFGRLFGVVDYLKCPGSQ
jgi:hypothetical protein